MGVKQRASFVHSGEALEQAVLYEVYVDLGAEGGAERDDECGEALYRLVVQKQVDRAGHRDAEGDVGEDGAHHCFREVAFEGAAFELLPVRSLFFGHAQNPVGGATQHAIVCFKIFETWQRTLMELGLLDDVTACAPAG